jgi:dihydroorotase
MSNYDLIIRNGTIVSANGKNISDIAIKDGLIAAVAEKIEGDSKDEFDAKGMHIIPGVIDSQVHFREPGLTHKEDLNTGSKSAILGGVTTFLEMPNTNPPCIKPDHIATKVNIAKETSYTDFGFFMGATGENLDALLKAHETEGCCGVKIFLGSSTGSLLLYDKVKLTEIFKSLTCPIAVHSESEQMLIDRVAIRDEAKSVHAHYEWRSAETALTSTKMIIDIAKEAGRKVHILHITTKDEIDFLKDNKEHCTVEITPQHLTLAAPQAYDELGTYAQMNPPIREQFHQDGLWEGIFNNTADVIGSDHAPHTREEKDKPYPKSPSGMPGVQTLLPLMLDHTLNGKITLEKLVELTCETPAKLYSLAGKGHIKVGYDADINILDINSEVIIKNEDMGSKCGWTPFHNKKVKGKILKTYKAGKLTVNEGKIIASPAGRPIRKG